MSDDPVDRPVDRPVGAPSDPSRGSLIRPYLGGPGAPPPATPAPAPGSTGSSIRPFLVTAGRTAAAGAIPVETQVQATPHAETILESLTFEYRDIVGLCTQPVAVAEIAARLSLHLGVIRVLVNDLQQQGLVATYSPEVDPTDDVEMIMKVIHGLRQRS